MTHAPSEREEGSPEEILQRVARISLFVAAGAATIAFFFAAPKAAVRGWLLAYVLFSQAALGSLALLLIHNLTPVRFGVHFGPRLKTVLWGIPLLAFFWIPVALNLDAIYHWVSSPAALPPQVHKVYLNPLSFQLRTVVALAGWMLFATLILIFGLIPRFMAAAGLVFFGLSSYVFGFDWILSIGAPFISSSFNAEMAIQCLAAGLAVCAICAPGVTDKQARGDVGGFLLAACLGVFYFGLMAFIVYWYGNLPDQAEWYLERSGHWLFALGGAVLFGSAIPIVSLLFGAVRNNGRPLRLVGASALLGMALHNLWLFAPVMSAMSMLAAALSFLAMMGVFAVVAWSGRRMIERERSDG